MMNRTFDTKTSRNIISFVLAAITVFAYGLKLEPAVLPEAIRTALLFKNALFRLIVNLFYSSSTQTWYTILLCCAVAYLYKEKLFIKREKTTKIVTLVFSAIVVFAFLLCRSFYLTDTWDLVFGGRIEAAKCFIKLVGFTPLVSVAVDFLMHMNPIVTDNSMEKPSGFKTVLFNALFMLAFWAPYFFLLYPGCLSGDGFDQLAQAIGSKEFCWSKNTVVLLDENVIINNHHPLLFTGVLKLVTMFAESINNYPAAFETLCIVQSVLLAFSFSYMIYVMKKHKMNKVFYIATLLFCTFNPLFPIYGMTIVKDTIFCAVYIFTLVQLYEILKLKKASIQRCIVFVLTVLVLMFARNNSVYLLCISLVFVVLFYFRKKAKMIRIATLILVPVLIFQIGFINIICPAFKISSGSPREMLSVPFMQTARYIRDHREEVSEEDEKIIATILNCDGDIDNIVSTYDEDFADKTKNRYNKHCTTEDFIAYLKVWLKGLIKHPMTYVEAYMNIYYGWFSFEGNSSIVYSTVGELQVPEMLGTFEEYIGDQYKRNFVNRTLDLFGETPITDAFVELSAYTWLYILLLFFIIKRKNKDAFVVCSFALFNFLINFLGPIAYMRYALPMVCLAPFAIFIVFKTKGDKNNGQNSSSDTLLQ